MVALPTARTIPPEHAHPLDPLTRPEILAVVSAVRNHIAQGAESVKPIEKILFNSIGLAEPDKYAVLRWAGTFSEKEIRAAGGVVGELIRQAEIHIIDPISSQSFEAIVDLPSNLPNQPERKASVSSWKAIDGVLQPSLQPEELLWAEDICRADAKVRKVCEAEGIDPETICVDGTDERFPGRRLQQCFVFIRLRPDDNLYAHPCDFVPVIDSHTGEVLSIDFPPTNAAPGEPQPASSAEAYEASDKRGTFAPPMQPHNYLPEQIMMDDPSFKLRETLKPLHVLQPEGVSYTMNGRVLEWEKFKVHVGFSYREGLVLSNITYNDDANGERPLFYRLSVAEMVVPYGKAVFPHQRKHAFDTGEYGIGALANSLALGCDCLGSITYLDADFVTRAGGIETIKSAICIHEEDAGILHKHTDFRDNKVHVARNRKLVISSICTVANYEYGFYFNFALDGSIELEVKATGIVNAYALKEGEATDMAHEVYVAPRIAAHHHQHLFSYRIDPMIDGLQNQVVQVDIESDEAPVGSAENFYGNGFHTTKTVYETAKGAVADYDASKCRAWVIENPNKKHYCTGGNVGYKVMSKDMPPMLAKPGSLVWNRAPFARHNMFVTPYKPDELFPSEVHINQNPGGEDFGLQKWVNRDENVKNTDIVCWPCFGVTHISRPEDWPIMPVEILRVHLKPSGFFAVSIHLRLTPRTRKRVKEKAKGESECNADEQRNPGLDVPTKADIKSRHAVEAFGELSINGNGNGAHHSANGVNGHANGHANGNGVNGHANGVAQTNGGGCCGGK